MPNTLASAALLLWVPIAAAIFSVARPPTAAAIVVVGALMFLPVGVEFDFQALPGFGKEEISYLCALIGALLYCPRRLTSARVGRGPELLVVVMILGCVGTVMTNAETLRFGPRVVSSLSLWDALSISWTFSLTYGLPFFLGRALFRDSRDLRILLTCLAIAGLVYSLFILVEIRLSPHFHKWTYGFHQHKFSQTIRWGGFRPMVYMAHGLAVSLFMVSTIVAYFTLKRAGIRLFGTAIGRFVSPFLLSVLLLCKSVASIVYGLFAVPLVAFSSPRTQARVAVAICCLVLVYPATRTYGVFPSGAILSVAESFDADRAASLEYRFEHEIMLLERARDKMVLGWGTFGRNRVFDPETGRDVSTTDSLWIIVLGGFGIVGLICVFGLLTLPVFVTWRRMRGIRGQPERCLHSGMALIVSIFALDLLVNGLFTSLPYFLTGALAGSAGSSTRRRRARSALRTSESVPSLQAHALDDKTTIDSNTDRENLPPGRPANATPLQTATPSLSIPPTSRRGGSRRKRTRY